MHIGADAVLVGSGLLTREVVANPVLMSQLKLDLWIVLPSDRVRRSLPPDIAGRFIL